MAKHQKKGCDKLKRLKEIKSIFKIKKIGN
jgi:hypothetical protein